MLITDSGKKNSEWTDMLPWLQALEVKYHHHEKESNYLEDAVIKKKFKTTAKKNAAVKAHFRL